MTQAHSSADAHSKLSYYIPMLYCDYCNPKIQYEVSFTTPEEVVQAAPLVVYIQSVVKKIQM